MINERTLVILKPDTIQRNLVGEILKRFENRGLKIVGLKMFVADEERVFKHYNKDDVWFEEKGARAIEARKQAGLPVEKEAIEYGKDIIRGLAKYMTAGPSIGIVYEGHRAVDVVISMVGATEPVSVEAGTIRGDYGIDSYDLCGAQDNRGLRNLVHASETPEEAKREIAIWFGDNELVKYKHVLERILYDINLDGIIE